MINTESVMKKGFTLIELLIVIAILGTLAVVVLIALNPVQQLAKTRDAGRLSTVDQLGHSLEAYAVNNASNYVVDSNTWMTALVSTGEISVVPSAVAYGIAGVSACTTNVQNGFCYKSTTPASGGGPIVVYARLEALTNTSKCAGAGIKAFAVYSSADGRAGVVCSAAEPVPGSQTFAP